MSMFPLRQVISQLPNLLVRRQFHFKFEMLPYAARNLSAAKTLNLFLGGLNRFWPRSTPFGRPVFAQVEPVNFCNLECPLCLNASHTKDRPATLLPLPTFQRFIDETGNTLLLVVLWNWGEPFLHPDLFEMIAYAHGKGVLIHCSTHGNVDLGPVNAARTVASGLDTLIFGVDGATQETYAGYRVGGDLNRVKANIREVLAARQAAGASTPRVVLRFVVMKHNEHELPLVPAMAEELGVDDLLYKTVDMPVAADGGQDDRWAPNAADFRRYQYEGQSYRRRARPFRCYRPWKRITLDAAGRVIPCEWDHASRLAYAPADTSPLTAWRSARAADFRRHFHLGHNDVPMCRDCTFKNRVAEDCTIARIVFKQPGT